jgi:precorrin isomerase
MSRTVHPIEQESYAVLRRRVDLSGLPRWSRAVVERVVHASADLSYVDDLVLDETALARGAAALRAGAPVVADVQMVAAGITRRDAVCRVREAVASGGRTRSAEAVRLALAEVGPGAVWVVGCAPTALVELLALDADRRWSSACRWASSAPPSPSRPCARAACPPCRTARRRAAPPSPPPP